MAQMYKKQLSYKIKWHKCYKIIYKVLWRCRYQWSWKTVLVSPPLWEKECGNRTETTGIEWAFLCVTLYKKWNESIGIYWKSKSIFLWDWIYTVVWYRWFTIAHESLSLNIKESCKVVVAILVSWNQLLWEYFHYLNLKMLHFRDCAFLLGLALSHFFFFPSPWLRIRLFVDPINTWIF